MKLFIIIRKDQYNDNTNSCESTEGEVPRVLGLTITHWTAA